MQGLPQFNSKKLCKALLKLGFEGCPAGKHQHKLKHPERASTGKMPFFVFPDNIEKKKEFQKALVRDLVRCWGFEADDIIEALK